MDELLPRRIAPRRIASDHRGVAEAIRSGWADVGVCLRIACEEAGLGFVRLREEVFELCYSAANAQDPRVQALIDVVRSPVYRRLLADLPGYDSAIAGDLRTVAAGNDAGATF